MQHKRKTAILAGIAIICIVSFLSIGLGPNWDYALPRRGMKVLAIVVTGGAIAFSTVVFQTIVHNRILTPSILGLDSLYMLLQTFIIFIFGSLSMAITDKNINFLLSVGLMLLFTSILYRLLFKGEGTSIYFLLLVGIIVGTFFQSITTFLQVLIDPNEFQVVQDRMFASFNNIHTEVLQLAILLMLMAGLYFWRFAKYLDVLALGREQAINLGVPYDYVIRHLLLIVAIFISVATALVGPITFLGLLVVNVAHEFLRIHQHKYLMLSSIFISIIALVGGQLLVERVFSFSTTVSVIINFIGGVYFIYLLLREREAW